jgi:steroid delta-isomerase-like uncharacterized protein
MRKISIMLSVLMFLLVTSCQDTETLAKLEELKAQTELEEQNKKIAERFHYDLSLKRDWEAAQEFISEDIIVHSQGGSVVNGFENLKGFDEVWANMHNAEVNHYEIIAEGDYVFIRWDIAFDHTSDLMGIPASGNRVSGVYGMDLFIVKDGKITELWQNWDQMTFLQQMGAMPGK